MYNLLDLFSFLGNNRGKNKKTRKYIIVICIRKPNENSINCESEGWGR